MVSLAAIYTDVGDAPFLKPADCSDNPSVMPVQAMVVGCKHEVKACIGQCVEIAVRGTEHRITGVGGASERSLQIHYREVGRFDVGLYGVKTPVIAVRTVRTLCGIKLSLMLHSVPGKYYFGLLVAEQK